MGVGRFLVDEGPFFGRTYGSFSPAQIEFSERFVRRRDHAVVFDPMAGQGEYLARLAAKGHSVIMADINPAAALIGALRSPCLLKNAARMATRMSAVLAELRRAAGRPRESQKHAMISDWLPDETRRQLSLLAALTGAPAAFAAIVSGREFTMSRLPMPRFAVGIALLGARRLCCYQATDNATWLRPGGYVRQEGLDVLEEVLDQWVSYARALRRVGERDRTGWLSVSVRDVLDDTLPLPTADIVVTSPPYANRLDYTRLWGPELAILEAMTGTGGESIRARQIGSNVVRGTVVSKAWAASVPKQLRLSLESIRTDGGRDSHGYYFKYFCRYSQAMVQMVDRLKTSVRPNGVMLLFIRDTVRKDILLPIAEACDSAAVRGGNFTRVEKTSIVVRSHIGNRQPKKRGSRFGTAQTEWFLAYQRVR